MDISEKADIAGLARDLIMHAVDELFNGHPAYRSPSQRRKPYQKAQNAMSQLRAYEFLMSKDFQFWCDIYGLDLNVDKLLRDALRARKTFNEVRRKRHGR